MATARQRRAINKAVENGGNISKAMVDSGYSPATAHTPQKLTESKGFHEIAQEAGLTPSLLTEALVSDIKAKPGNRTKELELGFKLLDMTHETEPPVMQSQTNVLLDGEDLRKGFIEYLRTRVFDGIDENRNGRKVPDTDGTEVIPN